VYDDVTLCTETAVGLDCGAHGGCIVKCLQVCGKKEKEEKEKEKREVLMTCC
jgi:hypothetical protein